MKSIAFAEKFISMVNEGIKTTTVRSGIRDYTDGLYFMTYPSGEVCGYVYVNGIMLTTFGELTDDIARTDGFNSLEELKNELLSFYPTLTDDSPVTVVYLEQYMEEEK